jgi:hypothetical protein
MEQIFGYAKINVGWCDRPSLKAASVNEIVEAEIKKLRELNEFVRVNKIEATDVRALPAFQKLSLPVYAPNSHDWLNDWIQARGYALVDGDIVETPSGWFDNMLNHTCEGLTRDEALKALGSNQSCIYCADCIFCKNCICCIESNECVSCVEAEMATNCIGCLCADRIEDGTDDSGAVYYTDEERARLNAETAAQRAR